MPLHPPTRTEVVLVNGSNPLTANWDAGAFSITAASFVTDTINEEGAGNGVTIDGVLLKDNGITATGGGSLTGTWSDLGTVTTVDINGGTIDGTTIGGSSAAAGTFTSINASHTGTTIQASSSSSTAASMFMTSSHASYTGQTILVNVARTNNAAFSVFRGNTSGGSDVEYDLEGDGNGYCDDTWNGSGADYAELEEWKDGNPSNEDRVGMTVVHEGEQIVLASAVVGLDPADVYGVVSGSPAFLSYDGWNKWHGKYERDVFRRYVRDENGDRVLSRDYDADREYVPRRKRPEWDAVGWLGKLPIRKGQPVNPSWRLLRTLDESTELYAVR